MRRYAVLVVCAIVLALIALKSLSGRTAAAAPLGGVNTNTPTPTASSSPTTTMTPTTTATPSATSTVTQTRTQTATPTRTTTPTRTVTPTKTGTPTKTATPTETPTIGILLPIILKIPTPTPTNTQTATPTQTSTITLTPTATHPAYTITTGHLSGNIALKDHPEVPQYYMNIEWIKFLEWIHNDSATTIEPYEILGVRVTWPDGQRNAFHNIWTGSPDYIGGLPPGSANCYGPSGVTLDWNLPLRCGADSGSAQTEDHVGASSNVPVDTPGTYTLQFYVCQSSSVSACSNNGEWHPLGGNLTFTAVPPPSEIQIGPSAPVGDFCQLTLTDSSHGSLHCAPYKPSKSRPGGVH